MKTLIVDHYDLDTRWESGLRPYARKIMVIDDMANRPHECDLLLDQNLSSDPAGRYAPHIGPVTRTLFGPRYALLRPAFAGAWRERSGPVCRILVFFGGADLPNATAKAVAAIALLAMPGLAVDVVIGAMYAHAAALEDQCAVLPGVHIHRDADMAALEALERRMGDLAESGSYDLFLDLNRELHFTIYRASGRRYLLQIISQLWDQSTRYRRLHIHAAPDRARASMFETRAIVAAARRRDTDALGYMVRYKVHQTTVGLLEHMQRAQFEGNGREPVLADKVTR